MCWIFLFPVAVISMIVLLMYENDRHTLKRNMARGRCGLPGMPNKKFFQKRGTECEADKEKEPFEKEMKVLKTDIHGHRKQIEETKERVENADKQLLTIDVTATGMKKKYDQIMFLLKEDILDAEEEYKLLNKKMASANELRQKFYSLENECEGMNKPDNCNENSFSRRSSTEKPKQQPRKRIGSCCAQPAYDQKSTDNSSDSGIIPSTDKPGFNPSFNRPAFNPSFNTSGSNPSFNTPGTNTSFNRPGCNPSFNTPGSNPSFKRPGCNSFFDTPGSNPSFNTPGFNPSFNTPAFNPSFNASGSNHSFNTPGSNPSFNAPGSNHSSNTPGISPSNNLPPDPCNKYPRPPCCPPPKPAPPPPPPPNPCHPPVRRPRRKDACERAGVPFCCKYPAAPDYGFPPQQCPESHNSWQQQSLNSNNNYSNDTTSSLAVRKTSTSVRNTNNTSSLINRGGNNYSSFASNKDTTSWQENDLDTFSKNSNKSKTGSQSSGDGSRERGSGSCCSGKEPSPQRNSSVDYGRQSNDVGPVAERFNMSTSSCCSGTGKPDPCAPPTYCPGRSACACCKCEPPVPKCPPSKLVKMPPYSTFFDERMPIKPCTGTSGTTEDDESDNISYDTQVVTEVTSTCTFPPKCCRSVYEDFLKKKNVTEPPNVKLPVFVDPCDPCAEVPREISPFEDVVNISHTCGTQTNGDSNDEKGCYPLNYLSYPLRKKSRIIP